MSVRASFKIVSEESRVMKTNLSQKLLLVLIASVSLLAAYNNSSQDNSKTVNSPKPQAEDTTSLQSKGNSARLTLDTQLYQSKFSLTFQIHVVPFWDTSN